MRRNDLKCLSEPAAAHKLLVIQEVFTFSKFGLVGSAATLAHMTIAGWLIRSLAWPPQGANAVAFLSAFVISFGGHYFWSFSQPGNWRQALKRFAMIAGGAFVINNVVLYALLTAGWLSPLLSTLASVLVVPLFTFIASRCWGFRNWRSMN
jgi:putative flippase GtrA